MRVKEMIANLKNLTVEQILLVSLKEMFKEKCGEYSNWC